MAEKRCPARLCVAVADAAGYGDIARRAARCLACGQLLEPGRLRAGKDLHAEELRDNLRLRQQSALSEALETLAADVGERDDGRDRPCLSDCLFPGLPGPAASHGLDDPDHGAVLDQLSAADLCLEGHPRV